MTTSPAPSTSSTGPRGGSPAARSLPIRMLHDRVLVTTEGEAGERRLGSGIVIPATAAVGRRLSWGRVVAVGPHVRQVRVGDRVLFDPHDKAEVDVQGDGHSSDHVLLRERDLHAVAEPDTGDGHTGLYL